MFEGVAVSDKTSIADLRTEHLGTLSAPLDAYWEEALIGLADHYVLRVGGERAGFYAINSDGELVAFHLCASDVRHAEEAFAFVILQHAVRRALAGTHDAIFLAFALDRAEAVKVHTLLFQDGGGPEDPFEEDARYDFSQARDEDFDTILRHYVATSGSADMDSVEAAFEGLRGYVRTVMDEHQIFVLRQDGELVATSECRISRTQAPYADVGMIVSPEHRRKGLGSYILERTKRFCYAKETLPICSCEVGNIGSQKAIRRAGFVARHRVLAIELEA